MVNSSVVDSPRFMQSFASTLAKPAKFLYFVGMRTGIRWGFALAGSVGLSFMGATAALAQTPPPAPPAASPPVVGQPGTMGPLADPAPAPPVPDQAVPASPQPPAPQPLEQPPQPPPIQLQKEPPLPPPVMRTDHVHDGFYARLSLGFGQLGTTMNAPDSLAIKGDGSTLALDVALGYAVRPGIVLGATLLVEQMPSVELSSTRPIVSDVSALLIGPFFDGYPNARGGFHLGGALGLAATNIQRKEAAGFERAGGVGLAGWVGYDIWVAEQWSAGLLLRVMGTRTKADAVETENNLAGSATMATRSVALMLTGVYN